MKVASLISPLHVNSETQRLIPACRQDRDATFGKRHNNGDWFVTRSTIEIIKADEYYNISSSAADREFDLINKECDILILKGGNFLSGNWLTENITYDVLKKIRIPIVYVGAGLQTSIGGDVTFTDSEIQCLKYIHDSSNSCSVRGEKTKEELAKIGIDNVRVTGCPTLFWSTKPTLTIKTPQFGKVAWTMRTGLISQPPEMHKKQFSLMKSLRDYCDNLTIMLQGEEVSLQEYFLYSKWGVRYHTVKEAIKGYPKVSKTTRKYLNEEEIIQEVYKKYLRSTDQSFLDWVMNHTFFSYDSAEYLDFFRSLDFIMGCRLHGNLVALSQGTPAYYITYDERTQEMVELFKIPNSKIEDFEFDLETIKSADWKPFEERYSYYYQEFAKFFAENNIENHLVLLG